MILLYDFYYWDQNNNLTMNFECMHNLTFVLILNLQELSLESL
jgi:hypothetical protein